MDMRWWGLDIRCAECKVPMMVVNCYFSADGELRFPLVCPKCKQDNEYRVYASGLQWQAMHNDLEKCLKAQAQAGRPLLPPVRPASKNLSDEDKRFLKEQGIDPEGEGK